MINFKSSDAVLYRARADVTPENTTFARVCDRKPRQYDIYYGFSSKGKVYLDSGVCHGKLGFLSMYFTSVKKPDAFISVLPNYDACKEYYDFIFSKESPWFELLKDGFGFIEDSNGIPSMYYHPISDETEMQLLVNFGQATRVSLEVPYFIPTFKKLLENGIETKKAFFLSTKGYYSRSKFYNYQTDYGHGFFNRFNAWSRYSKQNPALSKGKKLGDRNGYSPLTSIWTDNSDLTTTLQTFVGLILDKKAEIEKGGTLFSKAIGKEESTLQIQQRSVVLTLNQVKELANALK